MIQKVFNTSNDKDKKELWRLLPDNVDTIKGGNDQDTTYLLEKDKVVGSIDKNIIKISWIDTTVLKRPIDERAYIGCICWFWDDGDNHKFVGILQDLYARDNGSVVYKDEGYNTWDHFEPVKRKELKFAEDIKNDRK